MTPDISELRAALDSATTGSARLAASLALSERMSTIDSRESLRLAEESRGLAEELNDRYGTARAFQLIGAAHRNLADYSQAREAYDDALRLYEQLGDSAGVASVTASIGTVYMRTGEHGEALEYLQRALATSEELGDRANVARVEGHIGILHLRLGENTRALEQIQRALALCEELGDRAGVAQHTVSIGGAYRELGEYAKALEWSHRALALCEEVDDRSGVARATATIGIVFLKLGEYATALEYLHLTLARLEELGDRVNIATIMGFLGSRYLQLGEYAKALGYDRRALALSQELGDRLTVAIMMGRIGTVHEHLGQRADALKQYRRALALHEELDDRQGVAIATGNIGRLYATDVDEAARAEEYLLRAVEQLTAMGGNAVHLDSLLQALAGFYRQQENWKQAYHYLTRYNQSKEVILSHEAHKQAQLLEHRKQVAEMEKQRAIEQADAHATQLRAELLESRLEHKQQQLVATAINLARQSEILGRFRNDLRSLMQNTSDMTQIVRELKRKLSELPSDAIDWSKFEAEFEQTYPEFQSKLSERYPELTKMQLKICSLLRLKLTSIDIAQLLSISERTVEWHRLNLRKKLGIDRERDLHDVLAAM